MMEFMWQLTKLSKLISVALMLGCSQSPDTIAGEIAPAEHFSSSIAQLIRPKLAIEELAPNLINDTVQLEGTVKTHVQLLEGTLYLIEDTTGEIWVLSLDSPPAEGERVRVQGVLQYEEIVVDGTDISEYYLQEESRSQINRSEEAN